MSLDGSYDPDNIFAKILRGEMPAVRVFEDAHVLAFMDVFPQARGHTLVIPKHSSARNFLEEAPENIGPLLLGVQRVARAVRAALKPDGIVITQFNGAVSARPYTCTSTSSAWMTCRGPPRRGGMADMDQLKRWRPRSRRRSRRRPVRADDAPDEGSRCGRRLRRRRLRTTRRSTPPTAPRPKIIIAQVAARGCRRWRFDTSAVKRCSGSPPGGSTRQEAGRSGR